MCLIYTHEIEETRMRHLALCIETTVPALNPVVCSMVVSADAEYFWRHINDPIISKILVEFADGISDCFGLSGQIVCVRSFKILRIYKTKS